MNLVNAENLSPILEHNVASDTTEALSTHPSTNQSSQLKQRISDARENVIRLQIFLDQKDFGPGVIDGKMGKYTRLAIEAYHKKIGLKDLDINQLNRIALKEVPIIYATAIVPDAVNQWVDSDFKVGNDRHYQSVRSDMPYRSVAEFMAERYHTTMDFLTQLNGPEVMQNANFRSAIVVPNVEPFRIENMALGKTYKVDSVMSKRWAVVDTTQLQIRIYEPIIHDDLKKLPKENASENGTESISSIHEPFHPFDSSISNTSEENSIQPLPIYDEKNAAIVAAYPITPGKKDFIRYGSWKVKNAIEFPTWRFDETLLKTGQRGATSLTIPAGPNSPVGVLWLGLNKPGIGIHGTDQPNKIGRSRSAGCIRMSNWDVTKLPRIIRPGATIIIK